MHSEPMVATDVESWENRSQGLVYIRKYNAAGLLDHVKVQPGRKVQVTPQERRINQERAADPKLDVFQNGMLVPLRLIDSEPDAEQLQANADAMSETAMKVLFRSQAKTFAAKVGEISNPITLQRLMEIAKEVDATVRQVETIKARMDAVSPSITEAGVIGERAIGTKAPESEGRKIRGVTPR